MEPARTRDTWHPRKILPLNLSALLYALDMLGVVEAGGDNRGKEVEAFLREAEVEVPAPWCAAFVNWCARQAADLQGVESPLEAVPLQAFVQSYFDHGKENGWLINPKWVGPGDLFVLYYPTLKRYGHIGFVYDMHDPQGYFMTVEGNTNAAGGREGDGVYRKRRSITDNVQFLRWTGSRGDYAAARTEG